MNLEGQENSRIYRFISPSHNATAAYAIYLEEDQRFSSPIEGFCCPGIFPGILQQHEH